MRPYLAIIKDSFREAIVSRVLWVVMGVILLFLLAVAPLGYGIKLTGEFVWGDIVEWPELVTKLRAAGNSGAPAPARRVWELLDEKDRTQLARFGKTAGGEDRDYFQGQQTLNDALNKLVKSRDLYTETDWKGVSLGKEAQELLAKPAAERTDEQANRLNRLLIESIDRKHFRSRGASTSITYAWYESYSLPFTKDQVDRFAKEIVLTTAMGWIVGVFGMIAAILVTSTIVPQMFEPGSITLLLSKPVSRSALFVSKFLGACAFTLLNVSLLLGGLWLIAGLRFSIWNHGILWCIPLFLFMFLIYYAVSAFTGLIWKSAVISVVLTVIFWIACFVLDLTAVFTGAAAIEPRKISRMVLADDALLACNEAGQMLAWDESAKQWRTLYEPQGGGGIPTLDGPYYHAATNQILVGQGFSNPFGMIGRRITLRLGKADDGWTLRDGPALPSGTAVLLVDHEGGVLAVASDNIFRLLGQPAAAGKPVEVFGIRVPFTSKSAEFRPLIADRQRTYPEPLAAAADPQGPRIVLASGNHVYLFERRADGQYLEKAVAHLKGKETEGSTIAIAGKLVVVAREDGKVWLLDSGDLTIKDELSLESSSVQPRVVTASPDGKRFGVVFQSGTLWLIDAQTGAPRRAPISWQGDIAGFAFTGGKLLIGDASNRVVAYDDQTFARQREFRPKMTTAELAYYYGVKPLHMVSPKPRHLDNTVQYALTGKRTTDLGLFQGNLAQKRDDLHPWRPVASGLIFVGLMLLISCVYLEWHEF
jgi:ABC-type transport system involved in multi-copper enzyme maturation permease subunit